MVNVMIWCFLNLIKSDIILVNVFLPPANEVCEGYVCTPVCWSICSQGEHAWQGACMAGEGVCMAGGMWQGACVAGEGACMAGGMHGWGMCGGEGGMHATHAPPDTTRYFCAVVCTGWDLQLLHKYLNSSLKSRW